MALMEWGCNHQAFGRDVQPAITNSPTHLLTTTIRQTTTTSSSSNCAMLCSLRNSKAKAMAHSTHALTQTANSKQTRLKAKTRTQSTNTQRAVAPYAIASWGTPWRHHIVCPQFHSLRVKDCFPCFFFGVTDCDRTFALKNLCWIDYCWCIKSMCVCTYVCVCAKTHVIVFVFGILMGVVHLFVLYSSGP